jgi:excisionase family DNA binding protein
MAQMRINWTARQIGLKVINNLTLSQRYRVAEFAIATGEMTQHSTTMTLAEQLRSRTKALTVLELECVSNIDDLDSPAPPPPYFKAFGGYWNATQVFLKHALASLLRVAVRTLYKEVEDDHIPFFRVRSSIRFDPHQIADWLEMKMPPGSVRTQRENEAVARA